MQNIEVITKSKDIKILAKHNLTNKWKVACSVVLALFLLQVVPNLLVEGICGDLTIEALENGKTSTASIIITSIYSLLITGVFTFGHTYFFLKLQQRRNVSFKDAFAGFKIYIKTMALSIVIALKTLAWTLLLIVPGIIAAIRYSQAFFILADTPSKSVMQCIDESKEMMKRNKKKYFFLNLSFIGWYVLAIIAVELIAVLLTIVIIMFPTITIEATTIITTFVVMAVTTLAYMFLAPYVMAANAAFYELVRGSMEHKEVFLRHAAMPVPDPFIDKELIDDMIGDEDEMDTDDIMEMYLDHLEGSIDLPEDEIHELLNEEDEYNDIEEIDAEQEKIETELNTMEEKFMSNYIED